MTQPGLYPLKNSRSATDPRLGRIPEFDPRSANFPVRRLIAPLATPRSYTWPVGNTIRQQVVLDQGQEGACVGFSIAHELAARPVTVHNVDAEFAVSLYRGAQNNDEWPGNEYSGSSVLGGMKFASSLGYYKSYSWTKSADELAIAVSRKGPAVLGINWYESMFDVNQYGYLTVEGALSGGHAILCKGYNAVTRSFLLHNSWGPGWGIQQLARYGSAWVRHNDMQRLLDEDGEACLPLRNAYQMEARFA